jgi:hypothetical protein
MLLPQSITSSAAATVTGKGDRKYSAASVLRVAAHMATAGCTVAGCTIIPKNNHKLKYEV